MSAANRPVHRPLSPHLQVYRPQLTSVLSILHRATGIALSVGALYLATWVIYAAADAKAAEGKCGEGMKDMGGMKHMDGMSMTGDADYDFAANMRKHHQMAVDMSEAQLKKGKDADMLKMAKSIIAAQKKEIAELDRWLAAHKKPK